MVRVMPLIDGAERVGAIVLCRDVSDLRRKERQLVTKDATIREIHHRVKNNLQTVAALLRMQARRISSAEAQIALTDAMSRVARLRSSTRRCPRPSTRPSSSTGLRTACCGWWATSQPSKAECPRCVGAVSGWSRPTWLRAWRSSSPSCVRTRSSMGWPTRPARCGWCRSVGGRQVAGGDQRRRSRPAAGLRLASITQPRPVHRGHAGRRRWRAVFELGPQPERSRDARRRRNPDLIGAVTFRDLRR